MIISKFEVLLLGITIRMRSYKRKKAFGKKVMLL